MPTGIRRIGVLTSGGDAPGLNAVLRAVVKTAEIEYGWKVVGIQDGFEGLLTPPHICNLGLEDVRGLLPRGGTILGSTNKGHFSTTMVDGVPTRDPAPYREIAQNMRRLGMDALVVIGGEGSQGIASEFSKYGIRAVGVPKTIDNDLYGSDRTFGFDTALFVATDAIDRLHTTAASHDRVMVLEVMGRHAGWIALHAGLGGGADIILIPEIPFRMEAVASKVLAREFQGSKFSIIVVAEGASVAGGSEMYVDQRSARLGGIGHYVADEIARRTGKDARVVVLGHLQRGGAPTPYDRILATRFGCAAVREIAAGNFGQIVVLRGGELSTISMEEAAGKVKLVPTESEGITAARGLGIAFGDEHVDTLEESHDLPEVPALHHNGLEGIPSDRVEE
ncbi:MAG TPA: ATP-dependent 6-phosphofructokinase [Herpetosiphonaceae bacterium]|nr:ATP-dependent 6-phosphofructokinase [Herpetosiphonaceae bacterium]